ncbi:MAG: hypothetical protein ACRCZF_26085 [Gemmataceae bacterium]
MQLFCPSCQAAFAGTTHCLKCGGRLLAPHESFGLAGKNRQNTESRFRPSFGNRILLATLVGLGVFLAGRDLLIAAGLGQLLEGTLPKAGFGAMLLQVFAATLGGFIGGAARTDGLSIGAVAGVMMGAVPAGFASAATETGLPPGWYGMLITSIFALCTMALGGSLASRIWPPEAAFGDMGASAHASASLDKLAEEKINTKKTYHTSWFRIILGTIIALGGVMGADYLRIGLFKASLGLMQISSIRSSPYIGFEIAIAALFIAGMVAGSNTGAGLRHGLFVGLITAAGIFIACARQPDNFFPAIEGAFLTFGDTPEPITRPLSAIRILGGVVAITSFGGWLGGQLFLPLASKARQSRRLGRPS